MLSRSHSITDPKPLIDKSATNVSNLNKGAQKRKRENMKNECIKVKQPKDTVLDNNKSQKSEKEKFNFRKRGVSIEQKRMQWKTRKRNFRATPKGKEKNRFTSESKSGSG